MKSASFALGSLLAAVAVAQPHRQHHAFHHKRDPALVWVTEVDTVFETVGYTTTIWVSEGYVPPKSAKPTTSSASSASATPVAAQFFEPAHSSPSSTPSPPPPPPSTSSSSSIYVAPAPVTTPEAVPTPSAAPVYVAPVENSSPVAAAPVAPVESPEPAPYVAPTSSTPVAAPVTSTAPSSGSGGGSGGQCSQASPCEGDITHYDTSPDVYGACGFQNDGLTEKVIALPHELMGAQSNGNPYCGKKVTVEYGGKSIVATVVDKCMGCTGYSIDLSDAAFKALADMGVGRTTASWYFN